MATTNGQISFIKRGGIYYTDQFNLTSGQGNLVNEELVLTTDASLIDTRISQTSAKQIKANNILIRAKV